MDLQTDQFDFESDGVCIRRGVIPGSSVASLTAAATQLSKGRGGARVHEFPPEIEILTEPGGPLSVIAADLMGASARAVRVLVFDKSADRNWGLSWHQDRSIAVKQRVEVPGFQHWTVKSGVVHVEAPANVLECMVALRLHLDDCGPENGPLEVARGSYRHGRLPKSEIKQLLPEMDCVSCLAGLGDVVAMRGLTVHRSRPAVTPSHRRVIHVDYATCGLPGGLAWPDGRFPSA